MMQRFLHRASYPWLVISLCAFFLVYKYVLQVSPSVMTDQLMREFHVDGTGLGNLAATFFYSYFIMQLFVGVLLDKYSPRFLTMFALLLCAIGTYIFASTQHLLTAALGRMLIGVGTAFATVSYMKMVAVWFRADQFAFVGGLLASAAMIGAIFGQTPLALLVEQVGWRHSLILCACVGAAAAALFGLLVRDNNPNFSNAATLTMNPVLNWPDVIAVFKNKQNWLLTLYTGLAFCPVSVFGGLWGNPFLVAKYQLTQAQASSYLTLIFIGLAIGGPLLGIISDKLNRRKSIMLIGSSIALLALLPILYVPALPKMLLSGCLFMFGCATGAFMLGFALARELNKLALAATVIALVNTGDGILGSITEPLIGRILDLHWQGQIINGAHHFSLHTYVIALSLLPLYLLVAVILLFFVKDATR